MRRFFLICLLAVLTLPLFLLLPRGAVAQTVGGTIGFKTYFDPGTEINDAVGSKYSFRVNTNASSGLKLLFSTRHFYTPGSSRTYQLESNLYTQRYAYSEMTGCQGWPPQGQLKPGESGLYVSVPDYYKEGRVGVRQMDNATTLAFPRQMEGVDGIPGITKIETMSQMDITGMDGTIAYTRGGTFTSPLSGWGYRYVPNGSGGYECSANLPSGVTYRIWNVNLTLGGQPYNWQFALPDDSARYINPNEFDSVLTEFFADRGVTGAPQSGFFQAYFWDFQSLREGSFSWIPNAKWKVFYKASDSSENTTYGPKISTYNGHPVIEVSNDGTDTYYKLNDIFSLSTGSLTPSTDSCVIASGESFCNASFTWTSSNTTSLSLVDTNTETSLLAVTPTNRATPFSVLVANPVTGFELRDGSTVLDRVEIFGDCVTGTRWNGDICTSPPTVSNVTISNASVIPDAQTQYTIAVSASNSGGGSGIKSAQVAINSEGANRGAYRGLLAWSTGNLPDYTQKTSCGSDGSAGIYNGTWNNGAGKEYINLVRCTTTVSGNTRTVSFVVTFNPNFTSPTSSNTLSGSAVSDSGTSVWKPFGTFSISAPAPAVCDAPLTREVSVSGVSCDLNAAGVAATSGSVTRKQTQTKSAYPACAFPASPDPASLTVDNSTYVSDTCAYPQKVDGGWSAWSPASCPTTCGLDTSSQTRTCTNPVPSGGGAQCTADGSSASRSCPATAACVCSAPLSQEVTAACDAREGFTVTGFVTRIQTKSAYPECAFQTSKYKSDTCVYTPIQCPSGEAYDAATASCVACGNGGCTGAGGTPANPTGSLVCNNRSTETPTETETETLTEPVCTPPKKIVNGVCLLPTSEPPTTPEISGLWRSSTYLGGTAAANDPNGYQLSARATSPADLNLSYYFEWSKDGVSWEGDPAPAQWSAWTGSGGWGSVTHYVNYDAGTYYARAWAVDANDVWSLAPSAWTPFTLAAPGLSVSCLGTPGNPYIGQPVTWSSKVTNGSGSYIYEWNGTDDLFDTVATVQKTYTTPGRKQATLAVTDSKTKKIASAICTSSLFGVSSPDSEDPDVSITKDPIPDNPTDVVVKSCTASVTADPNPVEEGLNATLSWAVSDGALCASSCIGNGFDSGGKISGSAPGSTLPTPPTTTYTLVCTAGTYGPPPPANVTVTVTTPDVIITVNGQSGGTGSGVGGSGGGGGGSDSSLRVDPTKANNVTLGWAPANSSVESCVVTKDTDPSWKKPGGSSGSIVDSATTQTTYTVDCTNSQGAHSKKSVVVNALVGYEEF